MKKFLFLVTAAILNGGQVCQTQFWKEPTQGPSLPGLVLIWFRGFRGEDLNVKVYDIRRTDGRWTPSDGKISLGLWPGELKTKKRQTRYFHRLGYWGFIFRLILLHFSFVFFINLHFRKSCRMVLSFRFWALFDYWIFPDLSRSIPPPPPICQYDGTINDCHTSGRFDAS